MCMGWPHGTKMCMQVCGGDGSALALTACCLLGCGDKSSGASQFEVQVHSQGIFGVINFNLGRNVLFFKKNKREAKT